MKSFRSIALVLCMTLLVTLSCREELFELAGDHDIRVIYSDGDFLDPHTVTPTFVRNLSGGRVEIEGGQTIYFQVSSVSGAEVELESVEWINTSPAYMILDNAGWPEMAPLTFSINYSGAEDESATVGIVYLLLGSSVRTLYFVVDGYL